MKALLFLIVLSFSPIISAEQTSTNLVELNKMRATVALKKKPDGSFCQLDVRGNSKLTPSFVKSAHRKASAPKSDVPVCSESDIKAFQKGAKKLNLKGAKGQKTSVGALLGTLAKSAGVGCVFGAGISWVADMWKGNSNEEKTEAKAPCVDCANQKSEEEKELSKLKRTILAGGGMVIGTKIALSDAKQAVFEKISRDLRSGAVDFIKVQDKIRLLETDINKLEGNVKEIKFLNRLKARQPNDPIDRIEKKIGSLKQEKVFWNKVAEVHKQGGKTTIINDLIKREAYNRVMQGIPEKRVLEVVETSDKITIRDTKSKNARGQNITKWGSILSGIVGGVAGAIVCEDGTTYLLSEEKIEDI